MGFADFEESRELGEPINLFRFVTGPRPEDVIAYTDGEEEMIVSGVRYKPMPIQRDAVKIKGTFEKQSLNVRTSRNTEIAELFRVYPPSYVVSLLIFQGHVGDPQKEFLAIWTGKVITCRFENLEAIFTCEPMVTSMQRPALRRHYQIACPHVLYGEGCKAPKIGRPMVAVEKPFSNRIRASHAQPLGHPDAKFVGGTVEWLTAEGRREIRNITGVLRQGTLLDMQIGGSNQSLPLNGDLQIFLGCNHTMSDCREVFGNILNYGGQPWIPLKNPVGPNGPFI